MPRNIARELEEMGIEPEDTEYRELERADREHQRAACHEQFIKDSADFFEWRRRNRPKHYKLAKHPKPSAGASSPAPTSGEPFVPHEHDQTK